MSAFRRRSPLLAPLVSSTAVGKTSVVARRPPVTCSSSGSSFQLTCREMNRASLVVANAAYPRANTPGGVVGLTYRSLALSGNSSRTLVPRVRSHAAQRLGAKRPAHEQPHRAACLMPVRSSAVLGGARYCSAFRPQHWKNTNDTTKVRGSSRWRFRCFSNSVSSLSSIRFRSSRRSRRFST